MPIICATEICLQSSLLFSTSTYIFPFQFLIIFSYYCYSYIHKSRVYINIFWTRASLLTDDVIDLYWWACFDFSFHMFLLSSNRIYCNIRTLTPNTSLRLIEMWIQTFPLQIICFDSIAANYLIRPFIPISFSRWCLWALTWWFCFYRVKLSLFSVFYKRWHFLKCGWNYFFWILSSWNSKSRTFICGFE